MELRDHLRMLALHWLGVVAVMVVVVVGAIGYTFTRTEVYAADASGFVTVSGETGGALASINDSLSKSRATSYVDVATSRAVAERVIEQLGLGSSPASLVKKIDVVQPTDTVVLRITARDSTPRGAQELADAWVQALAVQVDTIEDPAGTDPKGTPQVVAVESAELPSSPIYPNPPRNLLIALVLGGLLGYAYALLRHNLDRRVRSPEVLQERFSVAVVGTIPQVSELGAAPGDRAMVALDMSSVGSARSRQAAEAFRRLRTNLIFMDVDHPPRIIVITSPRPGDGKSTVAANLAAAIAVSGQRVVLVDGDLRRPMVAASTQVDGAIGLTDVLVGRVRLEEALQRSSQHANLMVLPAGRIPPNPSELVGSQAMKAVLVDLAADALVLVDAPPVLPVADAAILTSVADGALVVITAGRTVENELRQALGHIDAVHGRTLGVIMNKTTRRGLGGYYYEAEYYGYDPVRAPGEELAPTPVQPAQHRESRPAQHRESQPAGTDG